MALLGQGWDDPQSAAIMALSAGLLGRNFAGGLMGANQAYAQGKAAQQKAEMDKLQIDMMREDHALKRQQMQQAMQKQAEGQAFLRSLMGGGEPSYSPGQLGSGSFGVVANADPLAAAPRRAGGLANATPEQIAMAKVYGFDLTEPWKVAKQGFELKPNSYRVDPGTNRREYIPDVKEGITMDASGRVVNMPGALDALTQRAMATEIPKAMLSAAGRLNLRDMGDGTQAPVSEFSENPALQRLIFGGAPIPPAAPVPAPLTPRPVNGNPAPGSGLIEPQTDATRMGILQKSLAQSKALLADPKYNDADKARFSQDVRDIEWEMAAMQRRGGQAATISTNSASDPSGGIRYGKTTAQKTQDEAVKAATLGVNESWLKNSYEPVRAAGSAASEALTNISVARSAMANMGATGWGTDAKAAAAGVLSGLGLAPKSVQQFATSAQTFQNAMATNLQTVLNAAKGPQTEGDADRARQTFAQLKNTTQANEFLLDLAQAKAERDAMKAKFYDGALPIARGKGDLTEVDREWSRLQPSVFSMPSMTKWGIK